VVESKPALLEDPAPIDRSGKILKGRRASGFKPSSGADSFITYILLAFIAATISYGVYDTTKILAHSDAADPASTLLGNLWGWIFCANILLFAANGPMVWLGVWSASKISLFRISDGPYLRSCAVAVAPTLLFALGTMTDGPLRILCFAAIVPALLFTLRLFFDLNWQDGAVGFAMAAMTLLVAVLIGNLIVGLIISEGAIAQIHTSLASADSNQPANAPTAGDSSLSPTITDNSEDRTLFVFRNVVASKNSVDFSMATREQLAPQAADLRNQLEALRPKYKADLSFPELENLVGNFERRVLALPSGKIDPAIFQDSADAEDWTTGNLSRGKMAPEVSFGQFKFQPPADLKIDLNSTEESETGLSWYDSISPTVKISLSTHPRKDPKQRRVVVSDLPAVLRSAETANLLAVDGAHVTTSVGQINGILFTRITSKPDDPEPHFSQYIGATDDNKWLTIRMSLPHDPGLAKVIDASARTIRKADAGEARSDPFAAKLIAPRIMENFDRVSALLIAQGSAAEGPVADLLASDNPLIRQHALEILRKIGTAKSLPALKQAMLDHNGTNSELARQDVAAIQGAGVANPDTAKPAPANAVTLSGLIGDLGSDDPALRKGAVQKLAFVEVDQKQRATISKKLAGMLKSHDPGVPADDLLQTAMIWADPAGVADFLPMLDEKSDAESRHAAMKILVAVKAPGAAVPIAKWLVTDPQAASKALIAIGAPAELATLAYVMNKSPQTRMVAINILAEIGTRRCLAELMKIYHDPRDANAQGAAFRAMEAVKARTGS
jgi:hypothetical protein